MGRSFQLLFWLVSAIFSSAAWAQDESGAQGEVDPDAIEAEEVVIDPNAVPSTEPGCFSVRGVRNFAPLSDEYVYVQQGGSHFLLTMDRGCFNLRSAQGIAIDNPMDRVCSNSQARVTYRGVGRSVERCRIRQVESVESRDAAEAIAAARGQ